MEGLPSQMLNFARLLAAEDDIQHHAESASTAGAPRGAPTSSATEIAARELILASCQVALRGYNNSLEVIL